MVLWWDRLCNHTRWTHLIINSALFIIKCVHCSDNSDFKSNGGWWRLRWYKFDDDFDDCGIGDVYHRSQVSVGRMGGSVINPRVFCIVRSLLMWSLCPYTISNFHIFTLTVSNSCLTPSDICIWVPSCILLVKLWWKSLFSQWYNMSLWLRKHSQFRLHWGHIGDPLHWGGWKIPNNFLSSRLWEVLRCSTAFWWYWWCIRAHYSVLSCN